MAAVTRIEDGFALTMSCKDGALIELQAADEEIPRQRTFELFINKGLKGTLDGLTPTDMRKLAEGIVALADAIALADAVERRGA